LEARSQPAAEVFVHPDHRRRGIGATLIAWINAAAMDVTDADEVLLEAWDEGGRAFLGKMGGTAVASGGPSDQSDLFAVRLQANLARRRARQGLGDGPIIPDPDHAVVRIG